MNGYQRGRHVLQRLPGLFVQQLAGSQPSQLLIDQWQELLRGRRVASIDGRKYLR